jgi:hypothetical protein
MNPETINQMRNQDEAEAQIAGIARLGMLLSKQGNTDYPDLLYRHIDERTELAQDNALSIEVDRVVRIVLCTGGPHCEIRWPEHGTASIVCYGWFGADRYERDLTPNELAGIEYAYGDWETLAGISS